MLELVSECVESYIARGEYGFEVQASARCGGYTAERAIDEPYAYTNQMLMCDCW